MIPFLKAHSNGNSFLLLEEADALGNHAQLARTLCDRNTGIGADGIEFLNRNPDPHTSGQLFLRLFNADGSEAELSGNGTRCVAAWLAHTEGIQQVTLGTHGGPRTSRVLSHTGPLYHIQTSMGIPHVTPRTITLPNLPPIPGAIVNIGNPHFVLFVDPASPDFTTHGLPWQQLGALLTNHPAFPHGANIEFVRIDSPSQITFRIFERGCGPTTSSGTGTSAAAAAAIALRATARDLQVLSEGGPQHVLWPSPDTPLQLTGPAELLCQGQAFLQPENLVS